LAAQPFLDEAKLAEQLELRVQLIVMNTTPVVLIHRILMDGRLLVEQARAHRIRFEVHARNDYFDLLPTLRRYRQTGSSH